MKLFISRKMLSLKNLVGYRANHPDGHLRAQHDRSLGFRGFDVGPTPALI